VNYVHDVVVVGAGGGGIPLAVRMAESGISVLLLEAGDDTLETNGESDVRTVLGAQPGHPLVHSVEAELMGGRPWAIQSGRALGGSTRVNGGYFIRARESDFERWSLAGGDRWSYSRVLPLLKRLESDQGHGESDHHGGSGPMPVERTDLSHPASTALLDACAAAGIGFEPDKNDQSVPGVGAVPTNVREGHRVSTSSAYLGGRPVTGLTIRTGTSVTGVRLQGDRAVGVETSTGFVPAGLVVLSAGAIGTGHLLMLSGVGSADELRAVGVQVTADLPVGHHLSDHPHVVIEWSTERLLPAPLCWLGAAVHATSSGSPHEGNIELLQSLLSMESLMNGTSKPGRAALIVSDLTPANRGRMRLRSNDPSVAPEVRLGYLRDSRDRAALRHGVRLASALLGSEEFGPGRPPAGLDEPVVSDDDALDRWVARELGTANHSCATAPIGPVVDGRGAVHGLRGLHVADTSILPAAPLRGPANTAVLVGELIADALIAG